MCHGLYDNSLEVERERDHFKRERERQRGCVGEGETK